jgi:hypothetical protein
MKITALLFTSALAIAAAPSAAPVTLAVLAFA